VDPARCVPTITHDAAQQVLAAAVRAASALAVPVCVAVADPGGHLVAFVRMDDAPLLSARIAQDKAYTVSAFNGLPTDRWFGMLENEPALLHGIVHTDRLVIFGGGVPLTDREGLRIGAVGVSGGSADQDRQIAEVAAGSLAVNASG
jgi:glc operon protein GlcG